MAIEIDKHPAHSRDSSLKARLARALPLYGLLSGGTLDSQITAWGPASSNWGARFDEESPTIVPVIAASFLVCVSSTGGLILSQKWPPTIMEALLSEVAYLHSEGGTATQTSARTLTV